MRLDFSVYVKNKNAAKPSREQPLLVFKSKKLSITNQSTEERNSRPIITFTILGHSFVAHLTRRGSKGNIISGRKVEMENFKRKT